MLKLYTSGNSIASIHHVDTNVKTQSKTV